MRALLALWLTGFAAVGAGCNGGGENGPPPGTLGGPCYDDHTCNTGLTCDSTGVCVSGPSDPCEGVDCSGHGTCIADDGTAQCICDAGYAPDGLQCVPTSNPCEGVTCSGHGSCTPVSGTAACTCDPGYHPDGLACVENEISENLCEGLVQDTVVHPMTPLAKPNQGQSVVDPEFGTTIRRITAVPLSEGENAVIKPMYATMQAWNADESRLILWHRGQGHELYDGRTYAFIRSLPISPTDIEQVLWDPVDPDVLYYPTNYNAIPDLMRYRVSTDAAEVLHNFQGAPASCPIDWGTLLRLGGDPQYMSWGPASKVIGLNCGTTKFLYDVVSDTVLSVMTYDNNNAPIAAPSGTLAYFEGGVYDTDLVLLRTLGMASTVEHACVGRSAAGYDTYNAVAFDDALNGSLVTFNLDTGMRSVIIGPSTGYPYPPSGTHLSAIATASPGWVALSIVGDPSGACVLCQEIVLAKPEENIVCRVAHHRSKGPEGGVWGYWAEPHNVISPSATRILFGSDWGDGPSVDSYVVELPSYVP